ncbi:MAG: glycosyltransferase [Acidobacteriota bacterium]
MTFTHCIITRFNVHINAKSYDFRLSPSWLAERFELFTTFCLPSVRGQECQDFTWLVLFDAQTPAPFRRIIKTFEQYPNFVPLFCGEFSTVMPDVRRAIVARFPETDYYLTTRLDNDDALSRKFVGALHTVVTSVLNAQQAPAPELYINFPNGLQYHNGTVYDFFDETNAFVSLLERNKPPHTVFWVDHPAIYDKAPVAQVETKPIFLQNVHGMNVYNYIRGTVRPEKGILDEFSLNL